MKQWNPSPHPISDLKDWSLNKKLEIRPSFQRREFWSESARKMLMDTILNNIPMPKIYLSTKIINRSSYRVVIDGQQRISAILDFLNDKYTIDFNGKKDISFNKLSEEEQGNFLSYRIDFNEGLNFTDEEIRAVYSRINKYSISLNKQELRRADYPGHFLDLAGKLSVNPFLDKIKLFSIANRRRFGDAEYSSELLAGMIGGIQNKKENLDDFYIKYAKWNNEEKKEYESIFLKVIEDLEYINSKIDISKTRFKQKADFYSLFFAIYKLQKEGCSIIGKNISYLIKDLMILNTNISPEAEFPNIFQDYAIKNLTDSNSKSNREWRIKFLYEILSGTYKNIVPEHETYDLFLEIKRIIDDNGVLYNDISKLSEANLKLKWKNQYEYQISNAILTTCDKKGI